MIGAPRLTPEPIDIPEETVSGLTYGASWAGGYWVSADGGKRWVAGRTRPDLNLVDSIEADDHDAAIRGEVTAEEIISAVEEGGAR